MLTKYKVVKCTALSDYRADLTFADGESGFVKLNHLAGKGVFSLWNDYKEFEKVKIDPITNTLCWNDSIDLDPVTLRENLLPN